MCIWGGGGWRASWFVGMAVIMLVTKAPQRVGVGLGGELGGGRRRGFRKRVLSGLDACKINILWTLPLH